MSQTRLVLRGSASNIVRLILSTFVAFILPPFLVRHLPPAEYSAWVLIIQMSAYVNLLDFGLQTALAKFVAEHHATGDKEANYRLVSTSVVALSSAALIGAGLVCILVWRVPQLFHQMPASLTGDVRLGLLVVGLSSAFSLPFSPFLAVFTGLQDYLFPTAVTSISKIASAAALIILLLLHASLVQLALAIAICNLITAIAQWAVWRQFARDRVAFSFPFFDRGSAAKLTKFGGALAIWTLGGLCVSGLDTVIVGHFDYNSTGFYAIGASAVNFAMAIVSSVFGPLMPAVSSLQSKRLPAQIGEIAIRTTRYCTLLLCAVGMPLFIGAFGLLRLWVGQQYGARSAVFFQVLLLGNVLRMLFYPYSLVLVATGKQHLATITAIAEGAVNLIASILLAQKMGALGVAFGTLIGSLISILFHLVVSMDLARATVLLARSRFVLQGMLRPLLCIVPALLLYPFWRRTEIVPAAPVVLIGWFVLTAAIIWAIGLNSADRQKLKAMAFSKAK